MSTFKYTRPGHVIVSRLGFKGALYAFNDKCIQVSAVSIEIGESDGF